MQENQILESIHQVIANLLCMFGSQNNYPDKDDFWSGILSATYFSVCSMYHTIGPVPIKHGNLYNFATCPGYRRYFISPIGGVRPGVIGGH